MGPVVTMTDQAEVIEFMSSPAMHGAPVERIDTHTSVVFLSGAHAYKMKRTVCFDYVDFSTLERRYRFCEAEVRLNRRTAPTLYKGVIPVVRREDGRLALGGDGIAVEWLVEMQRFDQEQLMDRMASANRLGLDAMETLAAAIAALHRVAASRMDHGGLEGMRWVVDGNAAGFADFSAYGLDRAMGDGVIAATRQELDRQAGKLEERRLDGSVKECHGDLHLRNVVLLDGRPTLFDGVEFNDQISCIDVLYDLAFLIMDLWHRRLTRHANIILNRYVAETNELEGLRLLPLFLSCRAAVRAKTSAAGARVQADETRRRELQESAGEYLAMAAELLRPKAPIAVAVGGLSGSGKSSVAKALAPDLGAPPGAVVLRSDEIRKRLCGVALSDRLGPAGYTEDVSRRVYQTLLMRARAAILSGRSVVIDAVFAEAVQRRAVEEAAAELGVPFVGCWLSAAEPVLRARVVARRGDPSDADPAVVRLQHAWGPQTIDWHAVDAGGPLDTVVRAASAWIADAVRGAVTVTPQQLPS